MLNALGLNNENFPVIVAPYRLQLESPVIGSNLEFFVDLIS